MGTEQDDILSRMDALLNKDKISASPKPEVEVPLLTEVYTPATQQAQQPETNQLLEELIPVLVTELEEMMMQAMTQSIVDLRPKTEALLRQHLLARGISN
jgi:hypothetical protein